MPEENQVTTEQQGRIKHLSYSNGVMWDVPIGSNKVQWIVTGKRFLGLDMEFPANIGGLGRPQSAVSINGTWYVRADKPMQAFLQEQYGPHSTTTAIDANDAVRVSRLNSCPDAE